MELNAKEILDKLLDENDLEPLVLTNSRGESARFDQIAVIPATAESSVYEGEFVEHNLAILQPLNDQDESVGRSLIFDFRKDEDDNYTMKIVDNPYVINEVMSMYKATRGITPEDMADPDAGDSDVFDDAEDDEETEETEEAEKPEATDGPGQEKKPGFFARLFGKKK